MKTSFRSALFAVALGGIAVPAHAAGVTSWVDNVMGLLKASGTLVVAIAFLIGMIAGVYFLITLIKMSKGDREGNAVRTLIFSFIVMALGLGFGTFVLKSQQTIQGDNADVTDSVNASDFGL